MVIDDRRVVKTIAAIVEGVLFFSYADMVDIYIYIYIYVRWVKEVRFGVGKSMGLSHRTWLEERHQSD
jgi:hypothetical protein